MVVFLLFTILMHKSSAKPYDKTASNLVHESTKLMQAILSNIVKVSIEHVCFVCMFVCLFVCLSFLFDIFNSFVEIFINFQNKGKGAENAGNKEQFLFALKVLSTCPHVTHRE